MKAFIFDFDGVIVDSQKYWDKSTMEVYQMLVPGWTEEDNLRPRGLSVSGAYHMIKDEYGYKGTKEEFVKQIDAFAMDLYTSKAEMIDGIQHLLNRLDALHIPIGIATASRSLWIHSSLDLHSIRHRFAAISTEDDVERSKPHPDVYLRTAKLLGVDPKDCVVLEDSLHGLTSAKAAGMYCIGFQSLDHLHRKEDLSMADKIIAHPDELTEEILKQL